MIEKLLVAARNERYDDVVRIYSSLSNGEQQDSDALMAYADALYELSDDLSAVRAYLKYVSLFPGTRGEGFALYGAAMALKNLDLHDEALTLLRRIATKENHPKLEQEIEHSVRVIANQNEAKKILGNL